MMILSLKTNLCLFEGLQFFLKQLPFLMPMFLMLYTNHLQSLLKIIHHFLINRLQFKYLESTLIKILKSLDSQINYSVTGNNNNVSQNNCNFVVSSSVGNGNIHPSNGQQRQANRPPNRPMMRQQQRQNQ